MALVSTGRFSDEFWAYLDRLVAHSQVVIDRPKGSAHPRYAELIYPLDYGYLQGTTTVDGGGIDVWVGSAQGKSLDCLALTVDLDKRDAEIKLLLGCTEGEKRVIMDFLNAWTMRACLVRREGLLRSRRSVRRFRPEALPEDALAHILEAATWAPSAHNRQPWRFAVLRTPASRARLAQAMGAELRRDLLADGRSPTEAAARVTRSRQRIQESPVAVLLCLEACAGDVYPDPARQEAEHLMGVQGVALAGGHLLLAAHAEGLGGVWTCAPLFAPAAARQALDLPASWQPQALLLLGYPAESPAPRPRRPLEQVTRFY